MTERRTIYIVTQGEYSDYGVLCAYENEADARAAVENGVGDDWKALPLLPSGDIPRKVAVHHAQSGDVPGAPPQATGPWAWDLWDFDEHPTFTEQHVTAPGFVGYRFSGTDEDRVRKAAHDRAARMRAEQEGVA